MSEVKNAGLEVVTGGKASGGKGGSKGQPKPRQGKPKDTTSGKDNKGGNVEVKDTTKVPPTAEDASAEDKGEGAVVPPTAEDEKGDSVEPKVEDESVASADGNKPSDEEFDKGKRDGHIEGEGEGQMNMDGKIEGEGQGNPLLKDTQQAHNVPFERQTKIEKSSTNVSIKSLFKEWKKDQLLIAERNKLESEAKVKGEVLPEWDNPTTMRFDEAVQRNEVWTEQQKSDLIHSILYGYYIPPVLVKDTGDGKKWFLDGKQRITTIMTFLNGQWALSKKTEEVYGHKIAGFKFKDLPEDMQDEIYDETVTIVRIKNLTTVERDSMFVKLNSGAPLSKIELTRAKHSELIEGINALAELTFFKDDLELSKKARVRFVDQEIILQIAMLMEEGKEKIKGFGATHIEEYVLRLKDAEKTLSDEMVNRFEELSTYINLSLDKDHAEFTDEEIKKSMKKIHVPMVFHVAEIAIKEKLQPQLFGQFVRSFLVSNYSVESKYGKSCQAGSSKKEAVITRLDEMTASLNDFIKMIREADTMEDGVSAFNNKLAEINGIERDADDADDEQAS